MTKIRLDSKGNPIRDSSTGLLLKCQSSKIGELVGKIERDHPLRDFKGYLANQIIKPTMQLCGAIPECNFFAHVIVVILKIISSKYVNALKSYGRNCELNSTFLTVATGFFLITFDRVHGFFPSSNSTCHFT
jgi:hypothetical protein